MSPETVMTGSRLRICEWVNEHSEELDRHLAGWDTLQAFRADAALDWRAPLRAARFAEARDGLFDLVGLGPPTPQDDGFWPKRGPVWDAVAVVHGRARERGLLLVEAKSHVAELQSSPTGAGGERLELIESSLRSVKECLGVPPSAVWTGRYYQIANRLAYLYYLRVRRQPPVPTWLLSVYFLGDHFDRPGLVFPATETGWRPAIAAAEETLALPDRHRLSDYVWKAFLPAIPPK